MDKMSGYGSLMVLLVRLQLASFDPTPLEQLTINLDLHDTEVKTPKGHETFEEDQDLKAGQPTMIVPVVIGGVNEGNDVLRDALYNKLGPWYQLAVFAPPRQGLAAANYNGAVYMVGGKEDMNPNTPSENYVQRFMGQNRTWVHDSVLRTGRTYFTLNTIQNRLGQRTLMVTGGITGGITPQETALRTTEIYFPNSKQWKYAPPMLVKRSGHAAAFLRGKLYVFGGDRVPVDKSTEVLDFSTKTWSFGPRLRNSRKFHSAAVLGDYVYTCGGTWAGVYLASCERFDGNTWDDGMKAMTRSRIKFGMLTIGAEMWAIGGRINHTVMTDTVEKYDEGTHKWSEKASLKLPSPRMLFGIGRIGGKS